MTQEDFIKILPAYTFSKVEHNGKTYHLTEVSNSTKLVTILNGNQNQITKMIVDVSEIKLILRTEEDLTEEEKSILSCIPLDRDAKTDIQAATKTINYLRSIGIDCDGLINAGFAIKQENLQA